MNKVIKTKVSKQSFGPISDLEQHLPSDWWRTLFTALYLKTDGDIVENDSATQKDVDILLEKLNLQTDNTILDLCCGQGRHLLELSKRGFQFLTGIDRSRYLIRVAKRRAPQIKFSEGDARKINVKDSSFDCVTIMGNSFGYFEKFDDDIKVLEEIKRVLISEGKIALDLADGKWLRQNFEKRSWEWIDEKQFVCRERSLSKDQTKLISREVIVHTEKGVIKDQFYAERLYDAQQIEELLTILGFTQISVHSSHPSISSRNQDLGMMAYKMFVTAVAPKKQQAQLDHIKKQEVIVLLGDPNLGDVIKKNGVFNEEDIQTINSLKEGLLKIENHSYVYMSNHKNLINFLQNNKPSFVLNFCDEGYQNKALMELHIPALLEMFNIPYSGANPACLAVCYDKSIVRSIAMNLDIPVPKEIHCDSYDQTTTIPTAFPVFVKPTLGDSSFGITKNAVVHNAEELMTYVKFLQEDLHISSIVIQEFLNGDEFSVGIIGNKNDYTVLPILQVNYENLPTHLPRLLGYESKWLPESDYWKHITYTTATLSEEERRKLSDYSIKLFERTGCRDYARFDFRKDQDGVIKLLEVNPNPGWCWDGKLNMMASMHGISYSQMLELILKAAKKRYGLL